MKLLSRCLYLGLLMVQLPCAALAQDLAPEPERWNAKLQATYIWQAKPSFSAPYSGVNSLSPSAEKSYSFTSTAFLGLRLARDTISFISTR